MSTEPSEPTRSLPDRPDLRFLKNQAKELFTDGGAESLTQAQLKLAREYGFASWPKLKSHVESLQEVGQLKAAIDANDVAAVIELMSRNPELHRAPMGYNDNGPLTWAAESRGMLLTPERLEIVRWMLENGSDVHQGGDGPLMRAVLSDNRIPVTELLVEHGADVNAMWDGHYPIILAPCETLAPASLKWLIQHGADVSGRLADCVGTLIATYSRRPGGKSECLEVMAEMGFDLPNTAPMAVHRGRIDLLAAFVSNDRDTLNRNYHESEMFPYEADFNIGGGLHGAPLEGGTLLQMAVEYHEHDIVRWLIDQGADANAISTIDEDGFGGISPLYHTAVTIGPQTGELAKLLLQNGADPNLRATFRRRLRPTANPENEEIFEFHDVTAVEFAEQFQDQRFVNQAAIAAIAEASGR